MTTLQQAAKELGGIVHRGGVLAPGPGHSKHDRSLWVLFGPEYPDGFWCKS
jgi:putative DNA primase/helicase